RVRVSRKPEPDRSRGDVEWRSGSVCGGVWYWRVHTRHWVAPRAKKHAGKQAEASHAAREIPATRIEPSKADEISVRRNVTVAAEKATAIIIVGSDDDISLVIPCAGLQPRLELEHVVRCTQVGVAVRGPDLQSTEFVYQEEVDYAGHGVGAVESRGAIL